ncbi:MAG: LacI family transcriptional regulator [Solirubrobacteraceae bacterium]|nr:LacI family transcriptional regulator [Solirubrobacteraceae bacterium]
MNAESSPTPTPQETFSESAAASNGRRPTMKQVAAVAGVSLATVSRVVNGGPSVGPDLAERVHRAVELLGYRHNLTASSLRRADRLSASIGLVFEDVGNPFFSAVHRGVEEVARRRGVLTFAGSSDEVPERERELAESFGARGVDGLIIVPAGADHSYLLRDKAAGVALVFVDRPARFIDADVVLSDNAGGASEAVAHLVAAGHRRIGYLGDRPELHTGGERLRGYRQALAAHGIEDDPALVHTSEQRPYDVTRELLLGDDPPTALFTSQNLITIDAVRAIHDLGVQHAVAHVGFDDVPLADVVDPGLTVVAQDPAALGRSAADLLFSRLDGYDGPGRRVVHPTTLIARGSGELPAPARAS